MDPARVSEHLCWGAVDGRHFNDLLPLPYTREALARVASRVARVQDVLKRPLLVENVSAYVAFAADEMGEFEFLAALARETRLPRPVRRQQSLRQRGEPRRRRRGGDRRTAGRAVDEMHLAGHAVTDDGAGRRSRRARCARVWALYDVALQRFGAVPTLVEWDTDVPALTCCSPKRTRRARG